MKNILSFLILLININIYSQNFQNIKVTDYQNPNEPSIIINPSNIQNIVVGENSIFYHVSNDGGLTWNRKTISSTWCPGGYISDPALLSDEQGNIYFLHLSNSNENGGWLDRIVCQKSTNQGQSFTEESYMGYNPPKDQDKQWGAIDNQNHIIYVTWTQFDKYDSNNPADKSNIMFSKSTDGGTTWSNAIQINEVSGNCTDSDNTVEGATPAVGPNGEVYVSWMGPAGLVFDKSTDQGQTWLENDIIIDNMQGSGGWDYNIPGISRCDGFPITKCDISNSPYRGTIYINWSDQRNGTNNTDIWLSKSTDGGNTWSSPTRVNNDNSNHHQFLTWMDIDQSTGYLYFIFYDRRNYNNNNTDVYLAVSRDGGNNFDNIKISQSPFIPNQNQFFGDYINLSVNNGKIAPVWERLEQNGSQSLMTAIITEDMLKIEDNNYPSLNTSVYPIPANNKIFVKYRLKKDEIINIKLLDESGRIIKTVIHQEKRPAGKNIETLYLNSYNLTKGIYYVILETKAKKKTLKIIKLN